MLSICNTNLHCFTQPTKSFKICGLHGHREPLNDTGVIGPFLFVDTGHWFPADLVTSTAALCASTKFGARLTVFRV
jgi:hypothetical protein